MTTQGRARKRKKLSKIKHTPLGETKLKVLFEDGNGAAVAGQGRVQIYSKFTRPVGVYRTGYKKPPEY